VNNERPDNEETQVATRYSVGALAEAADVSRRAVRFYVQRGLLAAPIGGGRGAYYTAAHLERLVALKTLQGGGMSLDDVGNALDRDDNSGAVASAQTKPSVPTETWVRVVVTPGVELSLKAGLVAADTLKDMVEALRDRLATHGKDVVSIGTATVKRRGDDDDDRT